MQGEDRKKAAAQAKEDALPPDQLAELQRKREEEMEHEKAKTAHLSNMGRVFALSGGRGGRGAGIALAGRGGRGRGGPLATPPPPPS